MAILIGAAAVVLSACTHVPPPDQAASGPQIDQLVWRVKCDLYDAFADRLNAPYGQEWLQTWVAQINLNLIVNDQSQLNPGVTLAQPLNIVTIPSKVSNFAQSFNLGLGAQVSDTATRNETIAFSESLKDLVKDFSQDRHGCGLARYADLQSELGLRDWVSNALEPVDKGYLRIGVHKAPKTSNGAPATGKAMDAIKNAQAALGGKKAKLLIPNCPQLPTAPEGPPSTMIIQRDIDVIGCEFEAILGGRINLSSLTAQQVRFIAKTIMDIQTTVRDMRNLGGEWENSATALEASAIELAAFVDPPIDTLVHQVQFVIVRSASASPSWTLVNFKGPGAGTSSLGSLTRTKTHSLIVTIGPPSSPDTQGAINALQTGTALGNALNTGALVVNQ